jgi:hypothetical protein
MASTAPGSGLSAGRTEAQALSGQPAGQALHAFGSPPQAAGGERGDQTRSAAAAVGEAFERMDAGGAAPAHLLRMTPRMVEVGVDDPAHGWIEVRAEGGGTQIAASLSAASPEAHGALHAQLSGMAQYLAEREIGVRSLAVGDAMTGQHAGGGPNQSNNQGANQGRDEGPNQAANRSSSVAPYGGNQGGEPSIGRLSAGLSVVKDAGFSETGQRISVRA